MFCITALWGSQMNKYLSGNFAPVREEVTLTDLKVTGSIPKHLDGRYVRIGPNPVDEVDPMHYHWFIGDGMVHGIRIRDGKAEWYRNRWVRSDDVADSLGEARRGGRKISALDASANTNIVEVNGRTFALVEAGAPQYELNDELESIGYCDFDGTLDGAYTAHPHRDAATGEMHAVSYYFGWGSKVRYTVLDKDAHIRKFVDVPVTGAPMVHDFALTKDYVVMYDLPVTLDVGQLAPTAPKLVQSLLGRILGKYAIPEPILARAARGAASSKAMPYSWDPDYPARVGVLPRTGTAKDVRWFDVDPCYVFHTMNAFQQGDDIVLDVVRHPSMFTTDRTGPNPKLDGEPGLYRWTVDREAGKVREELVDGHGQEFPRFDERLQGHQYRFGYSVGFSSDSDDALSTTSIIRHDLEERRSETRSLGARNASEFVFVPDSDDAPEERGVLLGYVYDPDRNLSDLEILDAQTLETVATIHLPVRVPYGFHGNWLPTTA